MKIGLWEFVNKGLIIKVNSDTFTVLCEGITYDLKARGKFRNIKLKPVVGDNVIIDNSKKVIEKILDRKNYLDRPPVANIDTALIITSIVSPDINLTLLDKLISIITINHIEPVIVFTKLDLANKEELNNIKKLSKYYESIGIKVFNNKKVNKIKKYLKNKIVTLCGQTGAGKSTLINKFDKSLNLETKEISQALGRGVHTTRIVSLYEIDNFYIVDTPGFSSIDIDNYSIEEIQKGFIEFNNIKCKFNNCKHINELGCNIIDNLNKGKILKSRYDNYIKFIKESK